jgi:hypothetical protein
MIGTIVLVILAAPFVVFAVVILVFFVEHLGRTRH